MLIIGSIIYGLHNIYCRFICFSVNAHHILILIYDLFKEKQSHSGPRREVAIALLWAGMYHILPS